MTAHECGSPTSTQPAWTDRRPEPADSALAPEGSATAMNAATAVTAIQRLGKGRSMTEITRFKGLGEISPDEFGVFIGENIRLLQVTVDTMRNVPELLNFYMGDNTPARREHIMNNLDATV